jgi:tetratricopeptide (TPR) repeat protein
VKKESVITAVVFLGVGFLAAYILQYERISSLQQKLIAASNPAAVAAANGSAPPSAAPASSASNAEAGLPAGHPPVSDATMIHFLEDEASEKPSDPAPPLRLADFLFDHKRFSDAVPWYKKSLALDPTNVNARTDLGTAYFNLGQPRQAAEEFTQSLKVDPDHQPTLFNMIVVSIEGTHDFREADRAWERLHRLNPDYPHLQQLKQELDAARSGEQRAAKN